MPSRRCGCCGAAPRCWTAGEGGQGAGEGCRDGLRRRAVVRVAWAVLGCLLDLGSAMAGTWLIWASSLLLFLVAVVAVAGRAAREQGWTLLGCRGGDPAV